MTPTKVMCPRCYERFEPENSGATYCPSCVRELTECTFCPGFCECRPVRSRLRRVLVRVDYNDFPPRRPSVN